MLKKIKEYIHENATLLFKTSEEESLKAVFDKKGFWFHENTQPIYNAIKSAPHIYVAFNKYGYYVGISNQSGGRWKREHAYHLGTLAYHLLGTIRKNDQNHLHWIEAWMEIESVKLHTNQNAILLKEGVYICFIPFRLYFEFNNHIKGDSVISKNIIKSINKEIETALIQSFIDDGKKLLNVQKLKKKAIVQTKSGSRKTPPPKNPKIQIATDFLGDKNRCVEFKVRRNQNISEVAQIVPNLPEGPSTIELISKDRNDIRTYINGKVRSIRVKGRTVSEYFNSPDTKNGNILKWKIVQTEMNYKKKIIETITIRVCPMNPNQNK
jgi:hypothetical protein